MDDKKILRNAARCKHCGETVESRSRHDFVTCSCGGLSVDGGKAYIKRGYKDTPGYGYEELSEFEPSEGTAGGK